MKNKRKEVLSYLLIVIFIIISSNLIYGDIYWSDSQDVYFSLDPKSPICVEDNGKWEWYEWDGTNWLITPSENDCYREDGVSMNGMPNEFCCSPTKACIDTNNDGIYECVESTIKYCSDYKDEYNCTHDTSSVASVTLNPILKNLFGKERVCEEGFIVQINESCKNVSDYCSCVWNSTDNKCYGRWEVKVMCDDNPEPPPITPPVTLCEYDIEYGNCTDQGFRLIRYVPKGSSDENCEEKEIYAPCLSTTLLNFVSISAIIIVIILIISYYILKFKNRKKSKKKQKKMKFI